jgi:excisionase family DNA binding protein
MKNQNAPNPFDLLIAEVRQAVREEIRDALQAARLEIEASKVPPKEWMRAEELAAEFNLPRTWFEEKGREGKITRSKPGRYVLFKRSDVERFLESQTSGGAEKHTH